MAILWLILKIILWTLLGLLGLVLVLLILPVTVKLSYSAAEDLKAVLSVLGIPWQLYPQKPKKEKKAKRPRKQKAKKQTVKAGAESSPPEPLPGPVTKPEAVPVPEQQTEPQPEPAKAPEEQSAPKPEAEPQSEPKAAPQPEKKAKSGGQLFKKAPKPPKQEAPAQQKSNQDTAQKLKELLALAGEVLSLAGGFMHRLLNGIWVHGIRIYVPVCKPFDAAATAITVGRIYAGLGAGLGVLKNFLHLSFKQMEIVPDYTGEKENQAFFSCKITTNLIIMIVVAVWALPKGLRLMKKAGR